MKYLTLGTKSPMGHVHHLPMEYFLSKISIKIVSSFSQVKIRSIFDILTPRKGKFDPGFFSIGGVVGAPLSEKKTMILLLSIPMILNSVITWPILLSSRETIAACFLRLMSEMNENFSISSIGA